MIRWKFQDERCLVEGRKERVIFRVLAVAIAYRGRSLSLKSVLVLCEAEGVRVSSSSRSNESRVMGCWQPSNLSVKVG